MLLEAFFFAPEEAVLLEGFFFAPEEAVLLEAFFFAEVARLPPEDGLAPPALRDADFPEATLLSAVERFFAEDEPLPFAGAPDPVFLLTIIIVRNLSRAGRERPSKPAHPGPP